MIEAGYAKDKADYYVNILLGNPKIIQEIEKNISEQIKTLNISKAYIVNKLLKVIEFSIQEEAILDKENIPTGKYKLKDASNCLKALIFLAKCLDIDSKISNEDNSVSFNIENLDIEKI